MRGLVEPDEKGEKPNTKPRNKTTSTKSCSRDPRDWPRVWTTNGPSVCSSLEHILKDTDVHKNMEATMALRAKGVDLAGSMTTSRPFSIFYHAILPTAAFMSPTSFFNRAKPVLLMLLCFIAYAVVSVKTIAFVSNVQEPWSNDLADSIALFPTLHRAVQTLPLSPDRVSQPKAKPIVR